MALAVKSYF